MSGHMISFYDECTNGSWYSMGVAPMSPPTAGSGYTVEVYTPSTTTTAGVSCTFNGQSYPAGATRSQSGCINPFPEACTLAGIVQLTCANGQWVRSPQGNPNTSCTFVNTPEGSQCGGLYHCGVGVNGNYWSPTAPCPPLS